MSFTFRVELPGELVSSQTGNEVDDGVIEWNAKLDGSSQSLYTQTVQRQSGSNGWARPVATISLVLLVAWLIIAGCFIGFVAIARRSKRRRREHALRNLSR